MLSKGTETRRIPFWVEVNHPVLGTRARHDADAHRARTRATTVGAQVARRPLPLPDRAATRCTRAPRSSTAFKVTKPIANFGVTVLSGHVMPHVVFDGDENHLVGFPGLPTDLNPYLSSFGEARPVAGAILPTNGTYDIVFDTNGRRAAGPLLVPLLGERHDAAEAAHRLAERRQGRRLDHRPRRRRRRSRVGAGHPRRPHGRAGLPARAADDRRRRAGSTC